MMITEMRRWPRLEVWLWCWALLSLGHWRASAFRSFGRWPQVAQTSCYRDTILRPYDVKPVRDGAMVMAAEAGRKGSGSGTTRRASTDSNPKKQSQGDKASGGSSSGSKAGAKPAASKRGGAASPPPAKKPVRKEVVIGEENAWPRSATVKLPDLNVLKPALKAEQLLQFNVDGHTITRDLCSEEEMSLYIPVIRAAFQKEELEAKRQKIRVLFGKNEYQAARTIAACDNLLDEVDPEYIPFLQTFNCWRRFQDVRRFALAKRFGHVAAQLLSVPRVRLYQDSTFMKRSGDGPTLWHSDLNMAPFDTNDVVTMWMPVTEVPDEEEGGTGLTFASRSHRDFALSFWKDPHAAEDLQDRYEIATYGEMKPGDATWHHGWTLHSSPGNELGEDRVAISLCFVADGARLLGAKAEHRPDDEDDLSYAAWVGDFKPGSSIGDHRLLPLVYDADRPT